MSRAHLLLLALLLFLLPGRAFSQHPELPAPLKMWESWATWNDRAQNCPTAYQSADHPICFWPSRLELRADATGGSFAFEAHLFAPSWIPLPGGHDLWPTAVQADEGKPLPVVEHDGAPSIELPAGVHRISGAYRWSAIPASLKIPPAIGILTLSMEGKPIDAPAWDAAGQLWLRRDRGSEETSKDFFAVKIHTLLEDGIPLWLHTRVELVVSGKSREEDLGGILPGGWKLSSLDSPLPIAVDENGHLKAQVRAGKWTIQAHAFNAQNPQQLRFAADQKPAAAEQLIAFRAKPDFRLVEITGTPSIDVSQTDFPAEWRDLPVYRWEVASSLGLEERMRGMGLQKPAGLTIQRQLWLDENGRGLTFRDELSGSSQQIWRLDASPGQNLGSVRAGGEGQLITRNPQNGADGFEIRAHTINFEATGRIEQREVLPATGWQTDAESVHTALNLPPGWRLFAVFGADTVHGDWLTAWTLLDLFLLLIFSVAVWKLWGFPAALLAFLAFALSYHEPGAPRYLWLILLVPLALLRVAREGWGRRLLQWAKWLAAGCLLFILVPFVTQQIKQALYPQLEAIHGSGDALLLSAAGISHPENENATSAPAPMITRGTYLSPSANTSWSGGNALVNSNLAYDSKARIQTGPGVPEWDWRTVSYSWNGPVAASQTVRPILISRSVERALTALRVVLLLALAAVLLRATRLRKSLSQPPKVPVAILLLSFLLALAARTQAQFPDQKTLDTLRERLPAISDAYPHAADIPSVVLTIKDNRLLLDAEIHAAIRTAVPLPGRLPVWSPIGVLVDGRPAEAMRRDDGFLWVVLEAGVHQVYAEGLLPGATEWEWTFQLAPHRVSIDAPGWTVSGLKPDGSPEAQIFFALKQKSATGEASYDRQDLQPLVAVERHLELGLTWQLRTTVRRLSPAGKALALRIPLLPGENVLSANLVPRDGALDLRLGAQEGEFHWESELPITSHLPLATRATDSWVESWHLVASPIWNISLAGLPPIFEPDNDQLVPVWHPWPGEGIDLLISRPVAIAGPTITVSRSTQEITLGQRQRVTQLDLSLRCSLGEDFLIHLPPSAEVTALTLQGKNIPVRKAGASLIVPLSPGEQIISLTWKTNLLLEPRTTAEKVVLPVESANLTTTLVVPQDRWVLWTFGPQRGPAVLFWVVLAASWLAAWILGRLSFSPLRRLEWMLLALGLTQVPLPAALLVVAWLFLLVWRGNPAAVHLPALRFDLLQILLMLLTTAALGVVVAVVGEGLLGRPEMFIAGNSSNAWRLNWYLDRSGPELPRPGCILVSIWVYRFLMLLWALWLAFSLIRWLQFAWLQFSKGGCFKGRKPSPTPPAPPPLPV